GEADRPAAGAVRAAVGAGYAAGHGPGGSGGRAGPAASGLQDGPDGRRDVAVMVSRAAGFIPAGDGPPAGITPAARYRPFRRYPPQPVPAAGFGRFSHSLISI